MTSVATSIKTTSTVQTPVPEQKFTSDRSLELKVSPRRKSLDAELYGLGKTLRHLQPPGGPETGVFDAFRLPFDVHTKPRKVNEYTRSHVFSPPKPSPPRPITPLNRTTHYKLFEMPPPPLKARRYKMTHSTVFDLTELPKRKIRPFIKKNPITGEDCLSRDPEIRVKSLMKRNPITFEGVTERIVPSRCKQPPGGRSTVVLEYHE
ncbi:uncharacterized protein CDAR_227171 [Caerostris darwini]|uniref:Uncharacterized protein n=1 Tax=Caerostris darwini TaxID=1538125 RepID=A0AAV4PDL3_9ARAC|nr:uncharacterized protein CDAR_227171 [Caerostris darwini]